MDSIRTGARISRAFAGAAELFLPQRCAGCGGAGVRWCLGCRDAFSCYRPFLHEAGIGIPVWAFGVYGGILGQMVRGFKDGRRRDLLAILSSALAVTARAAVEDLGPQGPASRISLVPLPTGTRARKRRGGRHPVGELAERALAVPVLSVDGSAARLDAVAGLERLLRQSASESQKRLGARQRSRNLRGTMGARRAPAAPVLLVDDVCATGSTLAEAARAVRARGGTVLGAVVLAAAP